MPKPRLERLLIVLGSLVLLSFGAIGVLTVTRGTPVKYVLAEGDADGAPAVSDSLFARTFELFTGTHLDPGNNAEAMLNGDGTYPRMWADLRAAQQTVTVQMYYSQPGAVADTMAAVLTELARRKVRVLFLLDAFGSQNLKKDWADRLRAAGVEIGLLRQLHWYSIHNATDRSHVRVIVIDGKVGYTGGYGLADYWLGDGHHDDQWRESNVRFTGPVVLQLQAAFSAAWAEATGNLVIGDLFFPRAVHRTMTGSMEAGLLYTSPTTGSTPAERFIALTISGARKSLYITNSYFVPDDDFRRMLIQAVHRGVDVRVLTVGAKTDVKTTWYAGRFRYEELMKGGVKVYEYQPTMIHSKTIVADGLWSSVGSMNFDNRSMAFNNESNLVVLNPVFGQMMDSTFMDDLRYSTQMSLVEFGKRGQVERFKERVCALLGRLL
ncbi:MAG: Phospholipase D-like domain protein [Gemmatimonadetes bacterium]|nr:Phospholipase D-like domain protein [Gemmatimonadota bacterium]